MKAIAIVFGLAVASVLPAEAQPLPVRAELLHQNEWLDDRADWMASTLSLGQTGRNRFGWVVTAGRYDRFQQVDLGGSIQLAVPVLTGTMIEMGAEAAPDSDFLAEWGARFGVAQELGGGWVASARATRRSYPVEEVDLGSLGLEYYVGEWRAAYTLGIARGSSDETGYAHVGAVSRYWGESGSVNASFATGREVETIGAGRAVILDVLSFDVWGSTPVAGPAGILFGGGYSDHETLGSRYRAQLGVRFDIRP